MQHSQIHGYNAVLHSIFPIFKEKPESNCLINGFASIPIDYCTDNNPFLSSQKICGKVKWSFIWNRSFFTHMHRHISFIALTVLFSFHTKTSYLIRSGLKCVECKRCDLWLQDSYVTMNDQFRSINLECWDRKTARRPWTTTAAVSNTSHKKSQRLRFLFHPQIRCSFSILFDSNTLLISLLRLFQEITLELNTFVVDRFCFPFYLSQYFFSAVVIYTCSTLSLTALCLYFFLSFPFSPVVCLFLYQSLFLCTPHVHLYVHATIMLSSVKSGTDIIHICEAHQFVEICTAVCFWMK